MPADVQYGREQVRASVPAVARGAPVIDFAKFLIYLSAMRNHWKNMVLPPPRVVLDHVSFIMIALSLFTSAQAQEKSNVLMPDSIHVVHGAFFVPSMAPYTSYIPPRFLDSQLSLADQAMIDSYDHLSAYSSSSAWKRSFLLGASGYKADFLQLSHRTPSRPTLFQRVQTILGVAELAGVAYLGYKAVKGEPITKPKEPKKK